MAPNQIAEQLVAVHVEDLITLLSLVNEWFGHNNCALVCSKPTLSLEMGILDLNKDLLDRAGLKELIAVLQTCRKDNYGIASFQVTHLSLN